MFNLLSRLSHATSGPLDLVVHIGPGAFVSPADYAPLQPAQIVLVEADSAAVTRLQRAFAGSTPQARIIEKLLLPNPGPASLFKFNLPAVNGIRPVGALKTLYPNLRLVEEIPLVGESFSSFLASLSLESEALRLLILDVQGQELALLESLSPDVIERFDWILLRGCASAFQEGANLLAGASSFLESRFFESVAIDADTDPAWPCQLLRLNRRHASLQRELDSRARLLNQQSAEIARQSLRIAQVEQELSESAAGKSQLTQAHAALEAEIEARARLLLEKSAEIFRQSERIAHLEPQLTQLHAETNLLRHELQAAGEISGALGQNIANSSAQLETAQAQIRALEARQLELDDELGAKKTLIQALTKGRAQQDQLFAELAAERDGLRESLAAAQLRITECEAQLTAKETRAALTDAEFQKIEGQMDIIKAMVFREHVR